MQLVNNWELILCLVQQQAMQEVTELKERLEKERVELESRLRQQIDQQQQRASDLDNQVYNVIFYIGNFDFVKLTKLNFCLIDTRFEMKSRG